MISHQYHCGCCNKVVSSNEKECPDCGSHNIRSPYGFWILCFLVCLSFIILFKIFHAYSKEQVSDDKVITEPIIKKI